MVRAYATSHIVGHPAYYDPRDNVWRYSDDHSETKGQKLRDCPKCGKNPTDFGGHDPCIAGLPGVEYACCGHGVHTGYAKFNDGRTIDGHFKEQSHAESD